jgi:ribonuclease Z
VWLTGWLAPFGDRHTPLRIVGPTGTVRFARGLESAYAEDVRLRVAEERRPPEGARLVASEFARDTVAFDERGVRVESFLVDHGGELRPAYGYRVRYAGRTLVISGDTRYNENVIRYARGADVLVHEVAMAPAEIQNEPFVKFILAHHTSPAEAARVFDASHPRLAVFTHFGFPPNRVGTARVTEADVLAEASRGYAGRIVNGEDLMRIVVADSVRVQRTSTAVPGASDVRSR